uniref:pEK499-p136 HEPN domain-containing protein n=1 Tax=Chlorobium chlorochromatii (strain CaD3) TaxID=340177 RepID=Q3AR36_CHLCH
MNQIDWDQLDRQMQQFSSLFITEVKIPKEKTNKIASIIADDINKIPAKGKKEIVNSISNPIPIQDRLNELTAFQGWMDIAHDFKNPYISRAQVIVQNYICFVYLGEACFKTLKQHLKPESVAKKCCNFLTNNPVRAFRNAVAHSNWKYKDDFSGIIFYARKGHQASDSIIEWQVEDKSLAFWQALSRCTAYTAFLCLK